MQPQLQEQERTTGQRKKVPVFRFPRDPTELSAWMKMLPFKDVKVTKDTVICERHWPTSYPTSSRKGKLRPRDPPSVWPGVPPSCCPDPPPPPRPTKRSSVETRAVEPDEMDAVPQRRLGWGQRLVSLRPEGKNPIILPRKKKTARKFWKGKERTEESG